MHLGEDRFGLGDIWEAVFNVYLEFAEVCDKHHLRYYVSDGCALGAVRHGGFIPWDDDFDVSMPRPDYEQFVKLAEKELPKHLKLVTWRNTPEFDCLFAKIQDSRENFVRELEASYGTMLSNGISLDIIPIDGASSNVISRTLSDKWFRLRRVLMRFKCGKFSRQTKKGKVYWLTGMSIYWFFPWLWGRTRLFESYERSAKKHDFDKSEYTIRACSNVSYRRKPIKRDVWGKAVLSKFGDMMVALPEKVRDYLKVEYGDFMKFPPQEFQKPSHQYRWRCPWWMGPTT